MTNDGISLRIKNSLHKALSLEGPGAYDNGTTTIEADSFTDGSAVRLYIQNKGFGSSSSKSVRTTIDNKTAEQLAVFFLRHLELSARVEAMRKAAEQLAFEPPILVV